MSRTGVFITVMSEIDRVKVEGEMDIFHTVKAARTDRPHMVSTVVSTSLYSCTYKINVVFSLKSFKDSNHRHLIDLEIGFKYDNWEFKQSD